MPATLAAPEPGGRQRQERVNASLRGPGRHRQGAWVPQVDRQYAAAPGDPEKCGVAGTQKVANPGDLPILGTLLTTVVWPPLAPRRPKAEVQDLPAATVDHVWNACPWGCGKLLA
jgi:hypothetical protein